jgi:magnesium-protoporphyrin IX monomethyl ester (oxidative) cyclase
MGAGTATLAVAAPAAVSGNAATARARADTLLSPRFYTTDFRAMDRLDVSAIRADWERLLDEFRADANRTHFRRSAAFGEAVARMPAALQAEFLDFLIASITAEFSGCILYADIKSRVANPDVRALMGFMSRDEARHANFINASLADFDLAVDLSFLKTNKKKTYFSPKFILYATYLSEKIGYARYITIFRQLERQPERQFHPIFGWFKEWCNDEFRHGEAFALLLRTNPRWLSGVNRLWIRFFILAVFATMYVRDHTRPALYQALGLDPTEFDFTVFRITTEIMRQVFPLTLAIDHPDFRRLLDRLCHLTAAGAAAKAKGGIGGAIGQARAAAAAGGVLVRLFLLPVSRHALPADPRLNPVW